MVATPDIRIKWNTLGLVPRTNMQFWHQYEAGVSGHEIAHDYSGNARNMTTDIGDTNPVLTGPAVYGQPAWYFDGVNTDPLKWVGGPVTLRHYFVLAAHDDAAFNEFRGLMSGAGAGSGTVLVSNNGGTTFFNLGFTGAFEYRKSGVSYVQTNQQAPMSGRFELLEVVIPDSTILTGLQVGKQMDFALRLWKGWWAGHMGFSTVQNFTARRRILLYYSLRYGVHTVSGSTIQLFFPSADLLVDTDIVRGRHYAEPRNWGEVTEEYEYEDSNKDFNQFGDNPPRRWLIRYTNVNEVHSQMFDVFNDTVGTARPFYFKDKYGYVWNNVRIAKGGYTRDLRVPTAPDRVVEFNLVGYNSVGTYEGF